MVMSLMIMMVVGADDYCIMMMFGSVPARYDEGGEERMSLRPRRAYRSASSESEAQKVSSESVLDSSPASTIGGRVVSLRERPAEVLVRSPDREGVRDDDVDTLEEDSLRRALLARKRRDGTTLGSASPRLSSARYHSGPTLRFTRPTPGPNTLRSCSSLRGRRPPTILRRLSKAAAVFARMPSITGISDETL